MRIPKKQRERLVKVMRSLRDNPRPTNSTQLEDVLYRVRVGQYGIIYAVFDDELVVFICKAARRTEATYRDIKNLLARARREVEDS
ncbi:MAG: type II toxin-antitoxin system RelE/ParE family toxin [Anaerolineales bacterium]|nr:type II toxin-antitoxin system RelE/ParE family toxin [Anaerolineales bacterium]